MKIFIDTSAWVALENKRDIHYKEAITVSEMKSKTDDIGFLQVILSLMRRSLFALQI